MFPFYSFSCRDPHGNMVSLHRSDAAACVAVRREGKPQLVYPREVTHADQVLVPGPGGNVAIQPIQIAFHLDGHWTTVDPVVLVKPQGRQVTLQFHDETKIKWLMPARVFVVDAASKQAQDSDAQAVLQGDIVWHQDSSRYGRVIKLKPVR